LGRRFASRYPVTMRGQTGGDSGITGMLRAIVRGDADVSDRLFRRVYDELHRLAAHRMKGERTGHTLQPTALVHEAFLRLVGEAPVSWDSRSHFYGAAARAMQRILVDHARRRDAQKRGDGERPIPLDDAGPAISPDFEEIVAIDEALSRMEEQNPRGAEVVRLRYFAGLSIDETAAALTLSPRTVRREWNYARAQLYRALRKPEVGDDG